MGCGTEQLLHHGGAKTGVVVIVFILTTGNNRFCAIRPQNDRFGAVVNHPFHIGERKLIVRTKAYDKLSEADQKRFCQEMLGKKEFFQDAYKVMMDSFEKAVEMQKDDVVSGKMKEQVEK